MPLMFDPNQQLTPQDQQAQSPGIFASLMQKWQDPNVRQAIMQTGLNLMRSPGYGQSQWDVGANALGAGVSTLEQLRERDRQRGLLAEDRATKEQQRGIENTRADRQVATGEKNAATNATNVSADIEAKKVDQGRADKALAEAIRHNKSDEEINRLRAEADAIRAKAYSTGGGKTPAEVEKLNRLKKYYMEKQGLDETDADKAAFDYLQTAKGKSPRQLVIDTIKSKVSTWYENQFDPAAKPTPEMLSKWQQEAVDEVKFAEQAGQDVTNNRGPIARPGITTPGKAPVAAPGTTPAASATPAASSAPAPSLVTSPAAKSDVTMRNIEKWKLANATPEQIKILIATGGEQPALYGY